MPKKDEVRNGFDMDIQLFADKNGTNENDETKDNSDITGGTLKSKNEEKENNNDTTEEKKDGKTYSQSELDRIVTKAIETREKKLKKEQEERLQEELKRLEAEKNNDYKTLYEQEKEKIAKEKEELQKERLQVYAESQLTKNKIDSEFINVVFPSEIPQSQNDIDARLEVLKNLIDKSNKTYVEELQKKGATFTKGDNKTKNESDRIKNVVKAMTSNSKRRRNIFEEA
jgi:hypothetical protein